MMQDSCLFLVPDNSRNRDKRKGRSVWTAHLFSNLPLSLLVTMESTAASNINQQLSDFIEVTQNPYKYNWETKYKKKWNMYRLGKAIDCFQSLTKE